MSAGGGKGGGNALVRDCLAAMPGWKRADGQRLDALVTKSVPGVREAVKIPGWMA